MITPKFIKTLNYPISMSQTKTKLIYITYCTTYMFETFNYFEAPCLFINYKM